MNSMVKYSLILLILFNNANVFAQSKNALSFVSSKLNNVSVPNAAQINFGTTTNFTIEAWIKLNSEVDNYAGIVAKARPDWYGYQLVIVDNKIAAEIRNQTEEFLGKDQGLIGTTYLVDGKWHHLAMVVDRLSTNAKLYVDGNQEADVTNSMIGGNLDNDGIMYIGSERNQNAFINGLIDEVRIWSVARTQVQLENNKSVEIDPTSAGLSAYYRFNQGIAEGDNSEVNSLLDLTSYNNNGTLHQFELTGSLSNWVAANNPTLPVELTSFTASEIEGKAFLNWQTATEVNNYGFDIERKSTTNWTKVGFVEGHGTTHAAQSYTYSDNAATGKIVYRLKQIDRDGKFEYSKEVEVTIVTTVALSQNYPNPFNPATVIGYSIASASHVSLKVFDMLGREVVVLVNERMVPGNYTATLDASRLSNGVYFYRLDAGSFSDVKRMIILK